MSIFKDSFHPDIKKQLKVRQDAINNRTSQNLQYYNSRNAWVRLSSSVNIVTTVDSDGNPLDSSNELANKYVLQGGILNNNQLRDGIGDFSRAYSTTSADGCFCLGIRPMPGITSVDIKSKGAYGSLREATVKFQCWDIKQLEDLELLYMRQGYTVLLEWGWSPYLNNDDALNNIIEYTDIINKEYTKEDLFKLQYNKSTKEYKGNYDSIYGFIKNYSWTARMDGGYDCTTTIISIGEVIESLKVNYAPFDSSLKISVNGLLTPNIKVILPTNSTEIDISKMNISGSYSKNILAGLFDEIYQIGTQISTKNSNNGNKIILYDKKYNSTYNIFHKTLNIKSDIEDFTGNGVIGQSDENIYISLETLTHLLNNYVLLNDSKAKKPFTSISVYESENNPSGSVPLLSLAHPLQISIDPTVCLIKNNLWIDGIEIQTISDIDINEGNTIIKYGSKDFDPNTLEGKKWWDLLINYINNNENKLLINHIKQNIGNDRNSIEEIKEIQRVFLELIKNRKVLYNPVVTKTNKNISFYNSFYDLISISLSKEDIYNALGVKTKYVSTGGTAYNAGGNIVYDGFEKVEASINDPKITTQAEINKINDELKNKKKNIEYLQFLNNLDLSYFVNNDWRTELGIIGNIYINVSLLYNLSVSEDLAVQDRKEKNDIAIYDFLKQVLSKISYSTGQVNNFDLFVDPLDNVARIIDINYVNETKAEEAYKDAFELQVQNLNAVVRSYKLESQVFPEQSTIIAIGAQAGGGALGSDANTLINFNRNIIDRIIPKKETPVSIDNNKKNQVQSLISSLNVLFQYIADLKWDSSKDANFYVNKAKEYSNALKDIINYFKSISKDSVKNKAIIPTKLSVTMDGIGGIIIGNIFKLPEEVLPKGYKRNGENIGARIGYIITGINHSVNNNDWITTLDAQTIILDEPTGQPIDYSDIKITIPSTNADPKTNTIENNSVIFDKTGQGKKALQPDLSLISNEELDIIKGNFITNTGNITELATIDGKPIGINVAKAFLLMKRAADKDGVSLKLNSGFRSPYTPIKETSSKGNKVSTQSQQSLYNLYLTTGKPLTAAPLKSNHGNEIAIDLNTGSSTGGIKQPLDKKVYQWLIDNAYKFGFVRWVAKEEWHWEYRPGEYQYNTRVPKNNVLYKGMKLD